MGVGSTSEEETVPVGVETGTMLVSGCTSLRWFRTPFSPTMKVVWGPPPPSTVLVVGLGRGLASFSASGILMLFGAGCRIVVGRGPSVVRVTVMSCADEIAVSQSRELASFLSGAILKMELEITRAVVLGGDNDPELNGIINR